MQVTRDGDHWAPIWTRDGGGLVYARANASGSEVVHHPLSGEAVTLARSTNRLYPCRVDARFADPDPQRGAANRRLFHLAARHAPAGHDCEVTDHGRNPSRRESLARWPMDRVRCLFRRTSSMCFVQSFPPSGTPRQISVEGGRGPMWSRDGQDLVLSIGQRRVRRVDRHVTRAHLDPAARALRGGLRPLFRLRRLFPTTMSRPMGGS